VEEANFDDKYIEKFTEIIKKNPKVILGKEFRYFFFHACRINTKTLFINLFSMQPPYSFYRIFGQVAFGNLLAWVTYAAIPVEEVIPGVSLWWLISLVPLGSAIGIRPVTFMPFLGFLIGK
jgi:hypothetical protein